MVYKEIFLLKNISKGGILSLQCHAPLFGIFCYASKIEMEQLIEPLLLCFYIFVFTGELLFLQRQGGC
jgi:hypothetical protein